VFYRLFETIEREGQPPRLVFKTANAPGELKGEVLLVDESSMVSKAMAADIRRTGITVVAVGDPGQLPPVEGEPFFTEASFRRNFTLTEIHRQALESPIIRQAHAVRLGGQYEADGEAVRVIDRLTGGELRATQVVLTGRRNTRMRMNAEMRRIRDLHNPLPRLGEPLICLRNTPQYDLCNGAIYYASRDLHEDDKTVGISTDEGDIEVPAIFLSPGHEYDRPEVPRWVSAFAFGYALTVHQAQGSEFDNVLLIDESAVFREDRDRWCYTAITRAKERIVIARDGSYWSKAL
jgi:exodeoxyribonuclease-5